MEKEVRLIDADALENRMRANAKVEANDTQYDIGRVHGLINAADLIHDAPTVDAVEVVRCKDCKSWEQYNACNGTKPHRCMNHDAIFYKRTAPDDFCSYGERKDNVQ